MPQPPASTQKVVAGVALAMVVAAVPFMFRTVRKREEKVGVLWTQGPTRTGDAHTCGQVSTYTLTRRHVAGARHAGGELRQERQGRRAQLPAARSHPGSGEVR